MKRLHFLKTPLAFLLVVLMVISVGPVAYAASTPDIQGAFSSNTSAILAEYRSKYGWSADDATIREWESIINGEAVTFERQIGYQVDYLIDNINTTRQYLGIFGSNVDLTRSGTDGAANIVAVALAELDDPESIEAPLGSQNVKYNTWFYGTQVHNSDENGDGVIDAADGVDHYFPWSAVFVAWCANECGYIDSGLFTRTSSCNVLYEYLTNTNEFDSYLAMDTVPFGGMDYTPVRGDLLFFEDPAGGGFGQVGIITQVNSDGIYVVEGNYASGVHKNFYSAGSGFFATSGSIVHVVYPGAGYDADGDEAHPEIIYAFLTEQMGMTPAAACGALGNIQVESSCIANTTENGYTWEGGAGYGLIQWTNTNTSGRTTYEGTLLSAGDSFYYQTGLRRTNLVNYCVTHDLDYRTLYGQLAFLKEEMNHFTTYSNAITQMNQCENTLEGAKNACRIWMINMEGIEYMLSQRQNGTQTYWNSFVNGGGG